MLKLKEISLMQMDWVVPLVQGKRERGETTLTITTVSKFCSENLSILLSDKQGIDYKIFMCIL